MSTRLRFIDAVRALFLVQGVVYHALLPFQETKMFSVSNPESVAGIVALTEWMHSFRMHGFFLISGLLSWRSLQKTSTSAFLKTRLDRLITPLIVVLLTANVWERSIIAEHQLEWGWRALPLPPLYFGALWFLACLAFFTMALPVVRSVVASSQPLRRLERWSPKRVEYSLPVLLLAGALLLVLVARTSPDWWFSQQLGFIEPASAIMFFGYFMAGALLARTGHVSVLATKPGVGWWIAAVAGWVIVQGVAHASFRGAWTLSFVLGTVYAIAPLRLIFWAVAHAVRGGVPRSATAVVEASFTVYLLHQLVVVGVASLLAPVPWSPLLKIPFIISAAFLLPFVFHRVFVEHSPQLAFLLNGVPAAPARERMRSRSASAVVAE